MEVSIKKENLYTNSRDNEIGKCPGCKKILKASDLLEVFGTIERKDGIIGRMVDEGSREFIICKKCKTIIGGSTLKK